MRKSFLIIILSIIKTISLKEFPECVVGQNFCTKCNYITNKCLRCENEQLIPDPLTGGCIGLNTCIAGKNYCNECDRKEEICTECMESYYPDENGGCSSSENCKISFEGNCLVCNDNYILVGYRKERLNKNNKERESNKLTFCKNENNEDFIGCDEINYLNGNCKKCKDGYFLNTKNKKCTQNENCAESIFGHCIKCQEKFYLDHSDKKKCKPSFFSIENLTKLNETDLNFNQNLDVNFYHCTESEDGKSCSKCEEDFYFSKDGYCIRTNNCIQSDLKNNFGCKKCEIYFYLSEDKRCVSTENCYEGDGETGNCLKCNEGYYLDLNDGLCKSNQEDDDLKFCKKFRYICELCEEKYEKTENGQCVITEHCLQGEGGECVKCVEGYFLGGGDHLCTKVEKCFRSEWDSYARGYRCIECDEGYYFDKFKEECKKQEGKFKNCLVSNIYGSACLHCEKDYYFSEKEKKCLSNVFTSNDTFYKCEKLNEEENACMKCSEGYYLNSKDYKCSYTMNCARSNYTVCLECDENYYCLNLKNNTCEYNQKIESENDLQFFKCKVTDEEGEKCSECLDGYTLNKDGLCINYENCTEIEEEEDDNEEYIGKCLKCKEFDDVNNSGAFYCLNKVFGCVETYYNKHCLICNNYLDFDFCDQCLDGYKKNIFGFCDKKK